VKSRAILEAKAPPARTVIRTSGWPQPELELRVMVTAKSNRTRLANGNAASPICPGLDEAFTDAQAAMSRLAAATRVKREQLRSEHLTADQHGDALRGMAWWNNLAIGERRYWLLVTRGGSAAEC
jgi:hypothetical protein